MSDSGTIWPSRFPRLALFGAVVACVAGAGLFKLWALSHPAEWFYIPQYLKTSVLAPATPKQFRVLTPSGAVEDRMLPALGFHAMLAEDVYHSAPLYEVMAWPLSGFGVLLLVGLVVGGRADLKRTKAARRGRVLRGTRIVTPAQYNAETKGTGLAIQATRPWVRKPEFVRIESQEQENFHIQIAGSTGAGKSSLIRSILYQIEARGDVAIVFDPDREYLSEFGRPNSWVLGPTDLRGPFWDMGNEPSDEAEATALAHSFLPGQGKSEFEWFDRHARAILAYLLANFRPTPAELAMWLADESGKTLDAKLKGSEHAGTMKDNAEGQRQAIIGTLNEIGKALRMLPASPEGIRTWTATQWVRERDESIFITSTPSTIEAVRPLQSMWLDMLILKLQQPSAGSNKRVWIILDELASLNRLPQLHSGLTKLRKWNTPMVLGFQNMAQVNSLYGAEMARTILEQADLNIVLKMKGSGADAMSDLIGKQEVERIRESRSKNGVSYNEEIVALPAVMPSEISGLKRLTGYYSQADMVVPIKFKPMPKRIRCEALIERMIPPSIYASRAGDEAEAVEAVEETLPVPALAAPEPEKTRPVFEQSRLFGE